MGLQMGGVEIGEGRDICDAGAMAASFMLW